MESSLSIYELGAAGLTACRADPRFSYALQVPDSYDPKAGSVQEFNLMIAMHGSNRPVEGYRNAFAPLATANNCFVLAPLFPIGVVESGDIDNYKYIDCRGLRFDLILLAMIEEVKERYNVRFLRRGLHGFSGGGQFVHRFWYLHPDKLDVVSIGAPGKVTLIDDSRDWWVGTRDTRSRFGITLDMELLRKSKVQLVIGANDIEQHEIHVAEDSPLWMPGANDAGATRLARIETLQRNLESHGIRTQLDLVPDVAHAGLGAVAQTALAFMKEHL